MVPQLRGMLIQGLYLENPKVNVDFIEAVHAPPGELFKHTFFKNKTGPLSHNPWPKKCLRFIFPSFRQVINC